MESIRTVRAALFDLDGTLLDTLQDLSDSMNEALLRHGLPVLNPREYKDLVGTGAMELARLAAFRALGLSGAVGESTVDEAVRMAPELFKDFQKAYATGWDRTTRAYPGIHAALSHLGRIGVPMAVLSNKPDRFTKLLVAHFFPDVPFVSVCGERAGIPRKPDPASARDALERLGTAASEIAYFGDSGTDMSFAARSGFLSVGVLWGFRGREELVDCGAEVLISAPGGIPDVFSGARGGIVQ